MERPLKLTSYQTADGRERQTIRAPEGIRFVSATVADPYVLVGKSDGSLVLLVGDTIAGSLSETSVDFPSSVSAWLIFPSDPLLELNNLRLFWSPGAVYRLLSLLRRVWRVCPTSSFQTL